jgi:hypothetical protein
MAMQQEGGSALGDDSGLGEHEWGSWPDLQVDSTVGPPHLTNKSRISNAGAISELQATGAPT